MSTKYNSFSIKKGYKQKKLSKPYKPVSAEVIKAIRMAGSTLCLLNITYIDEKGVISNRNTEPYEVKENKYWAYCLERQALRQFYLGNILEATVLSVKYRPRYPVKIFI